MYEVKKKKKDAEIFKLSIYYYKTNNSNKINKTILKY